MTSVMERLVERMNAHDLDGFVSLMHPDYHSEQPVHPAREFRSNAQVRANWSALFSGVPDFHAELIRWVKDGSTYWSEWRWTGTQGTGEHFEMRGVTLFQVLDDLIVGGRLYMEPVDAEDGDIEQAVEELSGRRPTQRD